MSSFIRILSVRWLFLLCLALPGALHAQREKLSMEDLEIVEKNWPSAVRTPTGLRYLVLTPGSGAKPRVGDDVTVLYKGMLLTGKIFDKALDRDKPFTFRVGRGQVIPGWDEGLQLMQVGEKRLLIIPYELAYGTRGHPPVIPRSATLLFEIELLAVKTPVFP